MLGRIAAAAIALIGMAAAQPVVIDRVALDIPGDWVRNDQVIGASFSPAGVAGVTIWVFTDLGDEGAEEALETFVETSEKAEISLNRGDVEEASDEPFDIYTQQTYSRLKTGAEVSRIYAGADPNGIDTVAVFAADTASFPRFETEGRAILASLRSRDGIPSPPPVTELPGEGGLDGVYASFNDRLSLDRASGAWASRASASVLLFDPLGQIYRGAPQRAGLAAFDACNATNSWRCGRYRVEGDHILLRWNDGTIERRSFGVVESDIEIDGANYAPSASIDASKLTGAYDYADLFNAGDWPDATRASAGTGPSLRLTDDGKFVLSGFTKFRNPSFGKDLSASGRFRVANGEITFVYQTGAIEVMSILRFGEGAEGGLMIGGRTFNVAF